MDSPVALVVFNRPEHTRASFESVRARRPSQLFVIADGPRRQYAGEAQRCEQVRAIVEQVDWDCEVHRDYADENLGLKRRVSSGLDWVFSHVDRAIVLEDDCVAHPDFFRFCDVLLDRYADDDGVAVVTGDNFQGGIQRGDASYYFSKYNHCWGWATWRRAWQHYDGAIPFWPSWRDSDHWRQTTPNPVERRYWEAIFDRVHRGEIDSWAYPWTACTWYHGGLTATPNVNLVTNIGFGPGATHTHAGMAPTGTSALGPIRHPADVERDLEADRFTFENHFGGGAPGARAPFLRRLKRRVFERSRSMVDRGTSAN